MADAIITPKVNPNKLFMQLKSHLFEVFKSGHWPAGLEENRCSCLEQEPCISCATYDRLVKEFQTIPVG